MTRLDESMAHLDETVDAVFEPWRGRPPVDRAAALVSNLADYGFVWVVLPHPSAESAARDESASKDRCRWRMKWVLRFDRVRCESSLRDRLTARP